MTQVFNATEKVHNGLSVAYDALNPKAVDLEWLKKVGAVTEIAPPSAPK